MQKRVIAVVQPVEEPDQVAHQEVMGWVNDEPLPVRTIGPEGGRVILGTAEFPDNAQTTVRVNVFAVDSAGLRSEQPGVAIETFQGTDTVPPATPEPPDIEVEDAGAEEGGGTGPAAGGETIPGTDTGTVVVEPGAAPRRR